MKNTKKVNVGNVTLGDGKIYIQSMLSVPAEKINESIAQAKELEAAGCQIIRAAVPEKKDAILISKLKENVKVPVVADIHFDYETALFSIEAGADKIRINPGNIGSDEKVKKICEACNKKNIPIRIGVNSGSLEKDIYEQFGSPTAEALVLSAKRSVSKLESFDFKNIVLSIKSSDVMKTVSAYRLLADECDYPLHLGITEAGTERMGIIKSAVGIGALLLDGIGDTIRVSLTADPLREIVAAKDILKAIGLEKSVEIISCPTCGRTKIDVINLAEKVEKAVSGIEKPIKIAVMGCAVNGPGEAREADFGIAGGNGEGVIFKKGKIIAKTDEENLLDALLAEINNFNG